MKTLLAFLFFALIPLPLLAEAAPVTLTFAGDYGATAATTATLDRINALAPEAHFARGDLSYSQMNEPEWCQLVKDHVKQPFLLVPGNHESDGINGNIDAFASCLPYSYGGALHGQYPRQYYVDIPASAPIARVILISPNLKFRDTQIEFRDNNDSLQWLKKAVDEAHAKGIKWVIAGRHKVCISTETKECEIGEELEQALIKAGVDVVLAGHVHAYERTFPLTCMKASQFAPECVASKDPATYSKGKGTVFMTAGTGGVPLRPVNGADSETPYFAATFGAGPDAHYGPISLTIAPNMLTARLIDATTGAIVDQFTLDALNNIPVSRACQKLDLRQCLV